MQLQNKVTNYFYHRNNRYNVTIAYRRSDDGTVEYGASFCRKNERFVKRIGREIAVGRMNTYVSCIEDAPTERWMLHEEILERLEDREDSYVPNSFTF